MANVAPPPNPSLVAIILVIQARSGPRFVHHHPPFPFSNLAAERRDGRQQSYENSSSSEQDTTTSSDEELQSSEYARAPARYKRLTRTDEEDEGSPASGTDGPSQGGGRAPWEHLLGLDASALERLLMPSDRSWHKKKFEVGFNDLVFVGWPVFIRENGTWRRKKRGEQKRKERSRGMAEDGGAENALQGEHVATREIHQERATDAGPSTADRADLAAEGGGGGGEGEEGGPDLRTFNVVFVLNPPILEYGLRVKEMHDHIVKKFGRALKWEQARANYVWEQSSIILKAKAQARHKRMSTAALYALLQQTSSLASAIATVYESISRSLIACVTLSPSVSISLQIPPATSTAVLPSSNDPLSTRTQPGLWLTTATTENLEESLSPDPAQAALSLAHNFTLLLLDDESKILADVSESGGPLAAALANYIRVAYPTKSFAKISARHSISLAEIQLLAQHLVYWRRALAIPPLHQRDIYIVSPNADMEKLPSAVRAYESAFPTLPSLPKMLQALSGTPRPYSSLIPSKDHKEAYFMILAWLLRGGWVAQLRSFAFVCVDSTVKKAVEENGKADQMGRIRPKKHGSFDSIQDPVAGSGLQKRPSVGSHASSDVRSFAFSPTHGSMSSLIMQPARASPNESKWLDHIGEHLNELLPTKLPEDELLELQRYWPTFTRYLNGHEPLEKITVREGLKRNVVWDILSKLGLFESFGGERRIRKTTQPKILVGFRHW